MNPEIKAQWVAALRSGEYEQGKWALHYVDENGNAQFCCLGVLCDLAVKAGLDVEVFGPDQGSEGYVCYDDSPDGLPNSVSDWSGLGGPWGRRPDKDRGDDDYALYALNDAGVSFEEIADVIEEEF